MVCKLIVCNTINFNIRVIVLNIESILSSKNMTVDDFILFCKSHTNAEIEAYFSINYYKLRDTAKNSDIDIKRTGKENAEIQKRRLIEIYGSLDKAYQLQKETREKTNLSRYGNKYGDVKSNSIKRNMTLIEKYGTMENYSKSWRKKCLDTLQIKYGSLETAFKHQEDLRTETMNNLYGVPYYTESKDFQEKSQKTCIERYGVPHASQSEEVKAKTKQTCLERYGYSNYGQTPEFKKYISSIKVETKRKEIETKRRNRTLSTSKMEDQFYEKLISIYGKDNVVRQYKEERYPFYCDFYIPKEDKFIECNFHWTHNNHPFDCTNTDDIKELDSWINYAKSSKYWETAVYVWSKLDVRKMETARKNKLNFEVIYGTSCEQQSYTY